MEVRPILSAMLRNKTGAVLVAVQIAFTLAVMVNAVFIVAQARREDIARRRAWTWPTSSPRRCGRSRQTRTSWSRWCARTCAVLRAMPGVVAATVSHQVPLSGGGWGDELKTTPGAGRRRASPRRAIPSTSTRSTRSGSSSRRGAASARTRSSFRPANSSQPIANVIITEAMADELFPDDQQAIGKTVYDHLDRPITRSSASSSACTARG